MGADKGGEPDEHPAHQVSVGSFWLDVTEVTNGAYGECVAKGTCRPHDPKNAERNGYEVLRGLKRQPSTKNIPVIMVSSKGEDTDVRWGMRQGAADYVTKPFTPESVLAAVGKQL